MAETNATHIVKPPWSLWLIAISLIGLVYRATFRWLVQSWLGSPYYTHGFAIIPIAAILGYLRLRRQKPAVSRGVTLLGASLLAGSLGLHLLSLRSGNMLLSAATLVPLTAGLVALLLGMGALRASAFQIAFMLFMLPLPVLERSTPALAQWIAATVGQAGRVLGIDVQVTGARIAMPQASLVVGAPCSGVNSLAALVTFAALYAYLQRGPLLSRVLLVVLAVPVALAANWVRVLLMVLIAHGFGVDAAMTYFHDWSSLVLFLLALGLLGLLAKVMRCQLDFDTLS